MGESFDSKHFFEELVSIVMPCYNAHAFLDEAISSVAEQTWRNWELLIIDDGSTDESARLAQSWAAINKRVKPIVNEHNMGVSKTRNRGIQMAKGQWIAFLDSDDVWEKDKLEKQMALAKEKKANFIFTSCSIIDQNSVLVGSLTGLPEKTTFLMLRKWNQITCSSVLINREALGRLSFEHDDSREDYLLWLRVLQNLEVAYAVNEPLVRYRIIRGSRSANKVKMIRDTFRVHRHIDSGVVPSLFYTGTHFLKSYLNKYSRISISRSNASARGNS